MNIIFYSIKLIVFMVILSPYSYANKLYEHRFQKNETILSFLDTYGLPQDIYYNLNSNDKELVSDIYQGMKAYILQNDDNKTLQALIEVNDLMQLHIYKDNKPDNKPDNFTTAIIPIAHEVEDKILFTAVSQSIYHSLISINSDLNHLAEELRAAFFNTIKF